MSERFDFYNIIASFLVLRGVSKRNDNDKRQAVLCWHEPPPENPAVPVALLPPAPGAQRWWTCSNSHVRSLGVWKAPPSGACRVQEKPGLCARCVWSHTQPPSTYQASTPQKLNSETSLKPAAAIPAWLPPPPFPLSLSPVHFPCFPPCLSLLQCTSPSYFLLGSSAIYFGVYSKLRVKDTEVSKNFDAFKKFDKYFQNKSLPNITKINN